jgi:hypothetical protein
MGVLSSKFSKHLHMQSRAPQVLASASWSTRVTQAQPSHVSVSLLILVDALHIISTLGISLSA